MDMTGRVEFLARGGPALWFIALLSVTAVALILWKVWRLLRLGAWSGARTEDALGDTAPAAPEVRPTGSCTQLTVRRVSQD